MLSKYLLMRSRGCHDVGRALWPASLLLILSLLFPSLASAQTTTTTTEQVTFAFSGYESESYPNAIAITPSGITSGSTSAITTPLTMTSGDYTITFTKQNEEQPAYGGSYTTNSNKLRSGLELANVVITITAKNGNITNAQAIYAASGDDTHIQVSYFDPSVPVTASASGNTATITIPYTEATTDMAGAIPQLSAFLHGVNLTVENEPTVTNYAVTITQPSAGGTISVTKADGTAIASGDEVAEGTVLTLTNTPDAGYTFGSYTVNGTDIEGNTVTVSAATTISATFTANSYNVTVSGTDHATVTGLPATAEYKSTVSFTVTPAEGYAVESVAVNGTTITIINGAYSFEMPARDASVVVTTKAVEYAITATGSNFTSTLPATATYGETVTFTVTPDKGYTLKSVSMGNTALTAATDGSYSFTMPAVDVSIIIVTEQKPALTIEYGSGSSATTTHPAHMTITFNPATPVVGTNTVTVTSDEGYNIGNSMTIAGNTVALAPLATKATPTSETKTGTFTLTEANLANNKLTVVPPTATPQQFTVKSKAVNGGVANLYLDAACSQPVGTTVAYDTKIWISLIPNNGYKPSSVQVFVNGSTTPSYPSATDNPQVYTFVVKGECEIVPTFVANEGEVLVDYNTTPTNGKMTVKIGNHVVTYGERVNAGTVLSITVTPNDPTLYEVKSISVNNVAQEGVVDGKLEYTVTEADAEKSTLSITTTIGLITELSTLEWDEKAIKNGKMVVKQGDKVLESGDKVNQKSEITVIVTPDADYYVPTLTYCGTILNTPEPENGVYIYNLEIPPTATTGLKLEFADNRESVDVLVQTETKSGYYVNLYYDAERKKRIPTSSASSIGAPNDLMFTVLEGTKIYGTATTTKQFEPVIKYGPYNDEDAAGGVKVEDSKFEFTAYNRYRLYTTWEKIDAEYTVTYTQPENGTISVTYLNGENTVTVYSGDKIKEKTAITVTFTANQTPDRYQITRVNGIPSSVKPTTDTPQEKVYTFTPTADLTLSATIAALTKSSVTYTLNGIAPTATNFPKNIKVTVSGYNEGAENYAGDPITVTVEALEDDYYISSFSIGGTGVNTINATIDGQKNTYTLEGAIPTATGTNKVSIIQVKANVAHCTSTASYILNNGAVVPEGIVSWAYIEQVGDKKTTKKLNTSKNETVWTGSTIVFTANSNATYDVTGLFVDGNKGDKDEKTGNWTYEIAAPTTPEEAATYNVQVEYKFKPVAITLRVPTGNNVHGSYDLRTQDGTVVKSGDKVDVNTELTLTITSSQSNWVVGSVTIGGVKQDIAPNSSTVTISDIKITKATTIEFTWTERTYPVSVSVGGGGNTGWEGKPYINNEATGNEGNFKIGTVTLYANPYPGYKVVGWYLNGKPQYNTNDTPITSNTLSVKVTGNTSLVYTVYYERVTYTFHTVNIESNDDDFGTVNFIHEPGTTGKNPDAVKDYTDRAVRVQAHPNPSVPAGRYFFKGWKISGGNGGTTKNLGETSEGVYEYMYGGNNTATITAEFGQNFLVKYNWSQWTGRIEVRNSEGELLTPDGGWAAPGTRLTITLYPETGFPYVNISINGAETVRTVTGTSATFTTGVVESDLNIYVDFSAKTPTNPGGGSSGIEDVDSDTNAAPAQAEQWYTLQGRFVGTERPTAAGIYIVRRGAKAEKVIIR